MEIQEDINEFKKLNERYKLEIDAKNTIISEQKTQIEGLNYRVAEQKRDLSEIKGKLQLAEDYFVILTERVMEKL